MKYLKAYSNIIQRAKAEDRTKGDVYYEIHHIFPRCVYPEWKNLKEHPWNAVLLTGREHFICHRLLAKAFPHSKLVHAPWKMACVGLSEGHQPLS